MRFWQALSFTETEQLVPLAQAAEEAGFHGVLLSDHVVYPGRIDSTYPYAPDGKPPFGPETEFPEPFAAICAMAAVTTRLHFNTAVYLAPLRHPLEVAKSVATAAVISGGRVGLGVGVGWVREEYTLLGQDFHTRGRRLDEMIGIWRAVWAGGMVEHHGRDYDFDRLQLSPSPPGPVPIYVGGASRAALRRAARLGDGWLAAGHTPDEMVDVARELTRLRTEAGRAGEPFDLVAAVTAAPDADLVRRLEEAGATSLISYPPVFTLGPGASLDAKRAALAGYGDQIIRKLA
jgi:probable F420-dependent oxidoreductase